MATLVGKQLKDTYDSLLKTSDNDALDETYKEITDGSGNGSNLYLGTGGNVGIGKTNPSRLLSLYSNNAETAPRLLIEQDGAGDATLAFDIIGTQGWSMGIDSSGGNSFRIHNTSGGVDSSSQFTIKTSGDIAFKDTSNNEAFYWDASAGSLGIGTTSPSHSLSIHDSTVGTGTVTQKISHNYDSSIVDRTARILLGGAESSVGAKEFAIDVTSSSAFFNNPKFAIYRNDNASKDSFVIDSSGNVGIGLNNPQEKLTISSGNDASCFLQVANTDAGEGNDEGLYVGLTTSDEGYVGTRHNASLIFETNNTERMRILPGGGLTFNGDTASVNALDDYEEGTWTATVGGSSNLTSIVEVQNKYTKIGNVVHLNISYTADITSSSAETQIVFALPFATSNSHNDVGVVSVLSGSGADRFGVGATFRATTSTTNVYIIIGANQINATGSATIKTSFTYIIE